MKRLITLFALLTGLTINAADFSIVGSGTTQTQGSATPTQFATGLRQEVFLTDAISAGAVQSFGLTAANQVRFNSELFTAYNINYKVFGLKNTVYFGGDANLAYGDGTQTAWQAGPILGNRFFLSDSTYILAQAAYDVALNSISSNKMLYTLGLAFRF